MLSGSVFGKIASVDTVDLGRAKLRKASTAALFDAIPPQALEPQHQAILPRGGSGRKEI
jgi:hypothetical protein